MYLGLRLVDLNNYLDIMYWFKMEMTKKIYLEPFKKCSGSLCFALL